MWGQGAGGICLHLPRDFAVNLKLLLKTKEASKIKKGIGASFKELPLTKPGTI